MSARVLSIPRLALLLGLLAGCGDVVREEPRGSGSSGGGASGGACERDCKGRPCIDGLCEPEVLASDLYFASRLALDETRVYWTSAAGTIDALALGGGARITLASGQEDPWDLAVDEQGIYWTDSGANTVVSMPPSGGATTLLTEAGNPLGIVVRNGAVHFTNTYDKLSNDEQVVRVPLPAGPASVVAATPGAWMLAVDDTRVYWTDRASGAVWSALLGGGDAKALAQGIVEPTDIEVDGEAAYVTALEATFRIPLAGGAPEALVWGAGRGLAIDATQVYVGTADGRVLAVPKTGGAALTLGRTELYPSDIAVDDENVYWIVRSESGVLVRTPK
ncbi:hypothetical protein [Polyangium aurulentum]|uniref:hypothetical protein n=1 Tax=Polyangium aurulentum TaxID=2567896 RepID=UPI0010AEA04D|nr:hypothetical protein [Polyangium aurulentum]UQA58964.1 hypothetical protein E8A73_000115 [Polyangium aurulentum]